MKRFHSKRTARGQFTLCALFLVTCLLLFALGPFQAAHAYLRGDSSLILGQSYRDFLHQSPFLLRAQKQPGSGELTIGSESLSFIWIQSVQETYQWDFCQLKTQSDLDWPERLSFQLQVGESQFQIHGVHDAP